MPYVHEPALTASTDGLFDQGPSFAVSRCLILMVLFSRHAGLFPAVCRSFFLFFEVLCDGS
jgi:hypothetical protein